MIKHISEILKELYEKRARRDLRCIKDMGLQEFCDIGGAEELEILVDFNALSYEEVRAAHFSYLAETIGIN